MSNKLKRITTRAKQIRKHKPAMAWTDAVKAASREIMAGKKVGTTKNANMKKRSTASKTVIVTGAKKRHHRHSLGAVRSHSGVSNKDVLMTIVGGMLGGMAGDIIYKNAPGKPIVKGAIETAAGAIGMKMTGPRKPFLYGLTTGVAIAGGVTMAHGTGLIGNVENMVSGIFDGMHKLAPGETWRSVDIDALPSYTAGMSTNYSSMPDHIAATDEEIDKWATEGLPPLGAYDWK